MYPRSHSGFKQSTYQPKFRVLTNQVFRVWDHDGDSVSDLERQVLLSRRTETELRTPKSSCLYAISLSYSHQIVKVINICVAWIQRYVLGNTLKINIQMLFA